jgi:pilus assembly protein CpaB
MDRKLLLVATLAASIGFGLVRLYLARFEREATGGPRTKVLVVTKDCPAGTAISRELLARRELPQAYLESRHIAARELEEIVGARLALPVRAGEALLYTDLKSVREPPRQLSELIAEGKRAFTLSARGADFDALLRAGDRVDIVLAQASGGGFVVQNVLVLAVGDELEPDRRASSSHAARADHVTLSVTPGESIRLAEAERSGPLRLIVRNPDDLGSSDQVAASNETAPPHPLARSAQ